MPGRRRRLGALTVDEERQKLLAGVASMYYEQGMTQEEIAKELKYSRSGISRLLNEAREAQIVEIRVRWPLLRSRPTEDALLKRFSHLVDVHVLTCTTLPHPQVLRQLGEHAARLVEQYVQSEMVLGVSWGTAVYEVANALHPAHHHPGLTVVQMIGALGAADPQIDGPELARRVAQAYGARYQIMPAPLIVDTEMMRDALMGDRRIRQVLDLAHTARLAIVGIGSTDPQISSMVRAGFLTVEEIGRLASDGAVGDVCGIQFDIEGGLLDLPICRRTVGIQAAALRRIPIVLGIAAGPSKPEAILGALRARLVNLLVTDETTARQVLVLDQQ